MSHAIGLVLSSSKLLNKGHIGGFLGPVTTSNLTSLGCLISNQWFLLFLNKFYRKIQPKSPIARQFIPILCERRGK